MSTIAELMAENEALKAKNADLTQQAKQLIDDLAKRRGASGNTDGKHSVRRADYDRMTPREQMNVGRQASKGEVQIVD